MIKTKADFLALTPQDIQKLSYKELKQAVSIASRVANKAISRLSSKESNSPALRGVIARSQNVKSYEEVNYEQLPHFSTKTKSKDVRKAMGELRNRAATLQRFLGSKTSTVKGWENEKESVRKEFQKATGRVLSDKEIGKMYEDMHKWKESNPALYVAIGNTVGKTGMRDAYRKVYYADKVKTHKQQKTITKELKDAYEKMQEGESSLFDEFDFDTLDDGEDIPF